MENKPVFNNNGTEEIYLTLEAEYVLHNGQKSKLINSDDQSFKVKLKNETIELNITKNFFISKIHCSVENVDIDRFELLFNDINLNIDKKGIYIPEESDENKISFMIGGIVNRLRIYYDKGFLDWSKPRLLGLSIEGIPLENIQPYYLELVNINSSKEKTIKELSEKEVSLKKGFENLEIEKNSFETKKKEIEATIVELNKNLADLNSQVSTSEKAKAEMIRLYNDEKLKHDELLNKIVLLQGSNSQLESDVTLKQNEKNILNQEVASVQTELRNLKKTFASYSNEYASFNKQSNWYILFYSILLSIPVFVLGFVFYKLFEGSIDLTTVYKKEQGLDIETIFISRIPFVVVAGILIQGSFVIFKLISLKIMDIQSEKLALSKIAILAQDIVNLSSEGLNLNDEQIFDTNIYLRMEMIKAHLKDSIGKEYEYKIRDISILDSLKERLSLFLLPFTLKKPIEENEKKEK
jgi:hypothetical protein